MVKYLLVDPPSGWMYGFPKYLAQVEKDVSLEAIDFSSFEDIYKDLLKLSKYPEKDIDFAIKHSRYWISS